MLPAMLALGEERHVSGKEILIAYAIGFEVGRVLNKASRIAETIRGFHTMAVWGNMIATAACARLLGLTVERDHQGRIAQGRDNKEKEIMTDKPIHAGIDVSKDTLDIETTPPEPFSITYNSRF